MSLADKLKVAVTPEEKSAVDLFKEKVKELAETKPGSRNEVLNSTAFVAGTLVAQEHITEDWALDQLLDACVENDYGADAERVAKAGIEAGIKEEGDKRKRKNPVYAKVFTAKQLRNLPPAEWTIDGVLLERSFCVIYGPPETGKSLLALDMLGCLASKNQWQGKTINGGNRPGLYIAAEGTVGLPDRVTAWESFNQTDMRDNVVFYPHPIQVGMDGWEHMLEFAEDLRPGLTVIDTLAETSGIVDEENSATQMNKYIRAVKKLMRAARGSVAVIHHTGRAGATARGSNALDGAADVMIKVEPGSGDTVEVFTTKLKEGAKGNIGTFEFKSVGRSAVLTRYVPQYLRDRGQS